MRKKLLLIVFLLVVLANVADAEQSPVKVGVIQSLSGFAADDGLNIVHGLKLAAKDLNSESHKVELLIEDNKSAPKETVTAYQKLKQVGVDALVVGPYGFTTESIIPLAGRDKIPVFNVSALLESVNPVGSNGYYFNNASSIVDDVKPFEQFLDSNRISSAVLIHIPSTWGRVQQEYYSKSLSKRGIRLLESIEVPEQDNNDWSSLLARISSRKPEVVVLLLNKGDINLVLRKAKELNFTPRFFGSKNTYDSERLNHGSKVYEGVCFAYPLKQLQNNKRFVENFKSEFKEEPRIYADSSYDSLFIITSAAESSRNSGRSIKETLRTNNFQGIVGKYRYNTEKSFTVSQSSLVCVKDGKVGIAPL